MKALQTLPEGYREIFSINLQTNKTMAVWLNAASVVIMVVLMIPAVQIVPLSTLFDMSEGLLPYALRFVALVGGTIAYILLHEAVHGIAMKCCGTKKVKYGFTGLYAYAGSDDYYDKKSYIAIALAPIAVWGVVIAVINLLVPTSWFWVVYFWQLMNLSGAVGDLYVTFKFARMPKDILVTDCGVGMTVYSKE